jgi:hypothetical protein
VARNAIRRPHFGAATQCLRQHPGFCAGMGVFVQEGEYVQSLPLPPPSPGIIGLAGNFPQNPDAKELRGQNLDNKRLRGWRVAM